MNSSCLFYSLPDGLIFFSNWNGGGAGREEGEFNAIVNFLAPNANLVYFNKFILVQLIIPCINNMCFFPSELFW